MAKRQSLTERFWSKVDKRGPDECWPWTGCLNEHGYGAFHVKRNGLDRAALAHRLAWELTNGPLPVEKPNALHSCDVRYPVGSIEYRKCCNARHLWPGTVMDNVSDREAKGRGNQASGDRNGTRTRPETRRRKLTVDLVLEIRASQEGATVIGRRLGVTHALIGAIRNRRIWKHVP